MALNDSGGVISAAFSTAHGQKERLMNKSSFDIIQAVVDAVRFVLAERRYMFACAVFPFVITLLTNIMLFFMFGEEKGSSLVFALLSLGAASVDGWFMFLQSRLIVFRERLEHPPQDPAARIRRHNDMRAAVLTWMIFKLWMVALGIYASWMLQSNPSETLGLATFISLLLLGAMIWSLRLAVAHILVGVGYSVRKYIFRVNGLMGSLRVLGLGIVVALPFKVLTLQMEESLLLPPAPDTTQAVFLITGISFLSVLLMVFLNAAAVFAMKDMLSREDKRKGIRKV